MKGLVVGLMAALAAGLLATVVVAEAEDGQDRRGPDRRRGGWGRQQGEGDGWGQRGEQRGRRSRQGRRQRPPVLHPLMIALDADKDGEISADEIANAAAALKALDKNGDGKLARDELRPELPGRGNRADRDGPGGPAGADLVERIMSHDENGDGKVTEDEMPAPMRRMLDRADTNLDGAIDEAEAQKLTEEFGRGRGGPGRGDRRGGRSDGPRRRSEQQPGPPRLGEE